MEKLYYSSYNEKQNMDWFATVVRVLICFIILTNLTEFSIEFCVDEVIKDRGGLDMRRRRRGKSSILGMPKAPQVITKETQASKLGDAPEGIPSFFNKYRYVFVFVSFM